MNLTFNFHDSVAVVTGAARGIGFRTALSFLEAGAYVAIWERDEQGLAMCEDRLARFGKKVQLQQVDIANVQSCERAAAALRHDPTILVNNAGITKDMSIKKMSSDDFTHVVDVNLNGSFHAVRALLPRFSDSCPHKRIINISSIVGLYGNFGQINYAASKAGIIGMTKAMARELGRKGFTVNAVAPGYTHTDMIQSVPADILASLTAKVPCGQLGQPENIAHACLFLASAEAGYINGAVVSVDGGMTI